MNFCSNSSSYGYSNSSCCWAWAWFHRWPGYHLLRCWHHRCCQRRCPWEPLHYRDLLLHLWGPHRPCSWVGLWSHRLQGPQQSKKYEALRGHGDCVAVAAPPRLQRCRMQGRQLQAETLPQPQRLLRHLRPLRCACRRGDTWGSPPASCLRFRSSSHLASVSLVPFAFGLGSSSVFSFLGPLFIAFGRLRRRYPVAVAAVRQWQATCPWRQGHQAP